MAFEMISFQRLTYYQMLVSFVGLKELSFSQ